MNGDQGKPFIRLFGTPRCETEGQAFFPAKGFVLVAALLLSPGFFLTRQAAAALLWEEADQKRALGNLRQLLSRLQPLATADGAFVTGTPTGLSAGVLAQKSDLAFFLSALRSEDVGLRLQALCSVDGELLAGLEENQEQFYLWLVSERQRLKDLFFSALGPTLEDLTRFGGAKTTDIAALADVALRLEPEREETFRALMAAYARAGDIAASDRIFQMLTRQLQLEGRNPEPATLALQRRNRSYAAPAAEEKPAAAPEKAVRKPRVAFLPPVTLQAGTASFPIAHAFVEDVANSLVRYRTFTVLAPHSSFASAEDASGRLYQSLRADYRVRSTLIEPTRLSISLIEEETAEVVWALEVALDAEQVHAAFRLLSKQIAAALAEQIERLQVDPFRPHDANAYQRLLAGQHLLRGKCDLPSLRRARAEFRRAVELDGRMATARARIAQTLQLEWLMLGGGDPHLLHRAKAEAEASLDIDPASGMGHWMCAVVALYRRDFDTSAQRFFEAEALAPNSADLLLQHADALAHFGQPDAAWPRFQQAIDLNPIAPDIYWWAGASIAFKREAYGEAVQLCRRMENDEPALRVLTASLALNGDLEAARQCGLRLQDMYPGMSARDISGLSPNRDPAINERFYHAFRTAGLP
ncbi:BTAD domain-containing putative transcriptional regulator [Rhizobium sp. SGZ-381]|uniref:BTAD domain-containing putative transcriptional regulator n=1 Tax=Rhizobium sp. SGZ-381 TaxID=3342800 RepID=UPI003671DDED